MKSIANRPEHWSTAGVLDPVDARRFLGRLHCEGIAHHACMDGRSIRVSVNNVDMKRAMELRCDSRVEITAQVLSPQAYQSRMRMLWTIPGGAFAGSIFCYGCGWEPGLIPMLSSMMLCVATEVFVAGRNQRREVWD